MGRRLGQHFLFNQDILGRIARAVCPGREPCVIEIGSGPGALTELLLEQSDFLAAIELDPVLAQDLRRRFAGASALQVVEGDVLEIDLAQWGPAVVCGNLPYYVTSPILEKTLSLGSLLRRAVFLVQREVAERITAQPGCRDYGYLSVVVQAQCEARKLFSVKAGAFRPPPRVESAVIELKPRPRLESSRLREFLCFAGQCFRQKRKTLRNNLAGTIPATVLSGLPEASLRAEQLEVPALIALHARLFPAAGESGPLY